MVKLNKTIVAIYIRVSTVRQAEEGFSLDAQTEHLTNYCKANGYTIFKIYADRGRSGKNTNRPELQQMLSDMREGKFNKILVMKLDRISRSVLDLENLITEMKTYNCDFESATEKLDTDSAMGMMFIRLLGIFAAFERDRKSERINETFSYMVENGQAISWMQPLGYTVEEIDGVKRVVKDKEKEEMVNDMFDYFITNKSIRSTYKYLEDKYGFNIGYANFTRIFKNPIYIGKYKENDNYCEPYLTPEQWDEMNCYLNNLPKQTPSGRVYLFSGLIRCSCCNCVLTGFKVTKNKNGKKYHYKGYRCENHFTNHKCESTKSFHEGVMEKYLLNNLLAEADKYLLELNVSADAPAKTDASSLKEELNRLNYMFQKNRISIDDYEKQYDILERKIKDAESNQPKVNTSHLLELKELNLEEYYHKLNDESKRAFWREYIDKIIFQADGNHQIFLR